MRFRVIIPVHTIAAVGREKLAAMGIHDLQVAFEVEDDSYPEAMNTAGNAMGALGIAGKQFEIELIQNAPGAKDPDRALGSPHWI